MENRARLVDYDRQRALLPHRIEANRAYAATPAGKESKRRINLKYASRNPDKRAAHHAVNNALRDGRIVREPCAECGATTNVQAHHSDYSRPLDVTWLCVAHHAATHRLLKLRKPAARETLPLLDEKVG